MLMIPTSKDQLSQEPIHSDYKQADILDSDVHPTDLAGSLINDFLAKGGKTASAHIISKSQDLINSFKDYIVGFKSNASTQKIDLMLRGKKVSALKTTDLASCIAQNPALGVTLSGPTPQGLYNMSLGGMSMIMFDSEFAPYKSFLEDVCYLLEYAKLHYKDSNNNTLIYHLESAITVMASHHKDAFMQVLTNALGALKTIIDQTFGAEKVDFLVSMFTQAQNGSVPRLDHSRVLEATTTEQADDGSAEVKAPGTDTSNEDFGYSIQVVTGILFIFLYLYVCVYVYDIHVYKDSLVYSNLLTSKKK